MNNINRREAIKRASYIMGGTLAAPTILSLLQGCTAQPGLNWKLSFFNEDQARMIMQIAEIILPKTDTPGATDLGVPKFIEDTVSLVMDDNDQSQFISRMEEFDKECKDQTGEKFIDLNSEAQLAFIASQHAKIEGQSEMEVKNRPFIWKMKELTIAGYFTTEIGMTQILQYVAIPTEYKGCISLEEAGGKTWAT